MIRDTSAFTTLDNVNMGMREDFRKWWMESGIEFPSIFESGAAEKGWNARQPEIDALKAENAELSKVKESALRERISLEIRIDALKAELNEVKSSWLAKKREINHLEAENERLRAKNAAMKDFLTT